MRFIESSSKKVKFLVERKKDGIFRHFCIDRLSHRELFLKSPISLREVQEIESLTIFILLGKKWREYKLENIRPHLTKNGMEEHFDFDVWNDQRDLLERDLLVAL